MTWDKGLLKHAKTGDSEVDYLLELASEWHVKAVTFVRLDDRHFTVDALDKCHKALVLAAMRLKTETPDPANYDAFREEFGVAGNPDSGPSTPNDPARIPRKPLPSAGSAAIALPLPEPDEREG